MNAWYVVYTQPQSERRALHHLGRQGYETYFPSYRKTRRHARRETEGVAPLFPRYLFVHLELSSQKWQAINHTRGVNRLIGLNGEPTPLPVGAVEEIQARQDDTGMIEMASPEFEKGRSYRIGSGPFEDFTGILAERIDQNRVVLLLNLLGRQIRIETPTQSLIPAG